jgi:hypothetical protein
VEIGEKCTQPTFGRRSDGVGRYFGVVWSCLEVEWGRWESVGRVLGGRSGVVLGHWEDDGEGALEILGRKLGDIGQTFVNLYDLLEVGLTEHPPKKTENK